VLFEFQSLFLATLASLAVNDDINVLGTVLMVEVFVIFAVVVVFMLAESMFGMCDPFIEFSGILLRGFGDGGSVCGDETNKNEQS
jgi:hypothetical protein